MSEVTVGAPESHEVLVRKVFPRRADVIDTAELRTLLATG